MDLTTTVVAQKEDFSRDKRAVIGVEQLTVDGSLLGRVFNIASGPTAEIEGLTISGGNHNAGAGVMNWGADLTLR